MKIKALYTYSNEEVLIIDFLADDDDKTFCAIFINKKGQILASSISLFKIVDENFKVEE